MLASLQLLPCNESVNYVPYTKYPGIFFTFFHIATILLSFIASKSLMHIMLYRTVVGSLSISWANSIKVNPCISCRSLQYSCRISLIFRLFSFPIICIGVIFNCLANIELLSFKKCELVHIF